MRILPVSAMAGFLASCSPAPPDVTVTDAWARPAAAGQSSAAYFSLANSGGADRLVSVAADGAEASLHRSSTVDGVARMRPLADGLPVGSGASVVLRPGGDHVMLMKLQRPLVAGGTTPLRLTFERSGVRTVTASIRNDGAGAHGGH
jgi:copper(I)-binding protein